MLFYAERAFRKRLIANETRNIEGDERIIVHSEFIDPSELKYYFSAADLVVLPYRRIDQSGVLFLALSAGQTVLGCRVGGLREVIEDGVSGFLCEPDDLAALTERLNYVLAH